MIADAAGPIRLRPREQQRSSTGNYFRLVMGDGRAVAKFPFGLNLFKVIRVNRRYSFQPDDVQVVQRERPWPIKAKANLAIGKRRHPHRETPARQCVGRCPEGQAIG